VYNGFVDVVGTTVLVSALPGVFMNVTGTEHVPPCFFRRQGVCFTIYTGSVMDKQEALMRNNEPAPAHEKDGPEIDPADQERPLWERWQSWVETVDR